MVNCCPSPLARIKQSKRDLGQSRITSSLPFPKAWHLEVKPNSNAEIPNYEQAGVEEGSQKSKGETDLAHGQKAWTPQQGPHLPLAATIAAPSGAKGNCTYDHLCRTFWNHSNEVTSRNVNYTIIQGYQELSVLLWWPHGTMITCRRRTLIHMQKSVWLGSQTGPSAWWQQTSIGYLSCVKCWPGHWR